MMGYLLAHSGEAAGEGPNLEFLIVGVALVVLAFVFFFQKNVKPQVSVVLVALAVALFTGAFALD